MKKEKVSIDPAVAAKVEAYVQKNYPQYEGKKLFIDESANCFAITSHKDGSPLILGKGIAK